MPLQATDKQIEFYNNLIRVKDIESVPNFDTLTAAEASVAIQAAMAAPRKPTTTTTITIDADGMYMDPATNIIYKVQFNKATGDGRRMYAKQLRVDGDLNYPETIKVRFEYVQGLVYKIKPEWKMTLAQAQAFGNLYGVCCNCGRTLTNEVSIELGIGPICRGWFA